MNEIELEKKETYVASIVHDLKNPIIAQNRILEGLIKQNHKDNNLTDIYKQMLSSSKMMFALISSILNTYKYSETGLLLSFEEFDFLDLVEEITRELTSYTSEEKDIILNVNVNLTSIVADKMHLRRVITNLLSNALRYKKEDTPVVIELNSSRKFFQFSITNTGHHIRPEIRDELFNKYVSSTSRFNSLSTGLGLYLSKQIITEHGGKMLINSTKDGINTFGFAIPKHQ